MQVRPRLYEITFTGQAGPTLCAAFDDCTVAVGQDTTTLRALLPDQAALWGFLQRIIGLGLDVVDLHMARSEPPDHAGSGGAPERSGRARS